MKCISLKDFYTHLAQILKECFEPLLEELAIVESCLSFCVLILLLDKEIADNVLDNDGLDLFIGGLLAQISVEKPIFFAKAILLWCYEVRDSEIPIIFLSELTSRLKTDGRKSLQFINLISALIDLNEKYHLYTYSNSFLEFIKRLIFPFWQSK
jgi:hypothetical protein